MTPSHPPIPGPGTVDVWHIPLEDEQAPPPQAERVLSAAELERAGRYHREIHRRRYVTAHTALREILGGALGVRPADVAFELGPHGKPRLSTPPPEAGLHFNLSGTEGLALLALSTDGPLGVDVERHRADRSLLEVAERFFSPVEVRALRGVDPALRLGAFHRIWTRKEAFVKAVGMGLTLDLDTFDVSLEPGPGACLLATRPDADEAGRWRMHDLDVGPDHSAALVVRARGAGAAPVTLRSFHRAQGQDGPGGPGAGARTAKQELAR